MATQYWLVKSEPGSYSWEDFLKDKGAAWTGIRNFAARNHLRAMRTKDVVLFYHSGEGKDVVGIARVKREHYPDATAKEGDWSAVDLVPVRALVKPVGLALIKKDTALRDLALVRQSRLSVSPVTAKEFQRLLKLGETPVPE